MIFMMGAVGEESPTGAGELLGCFHSRNQLIRICDDFWNDVCSTTLDVVDHITEIDLMLVQLGTLCVVVWKLAARFCERVVEVSYDLVDVDCRTFSPFTTWMCHFVSHYFSP